jgi:hypothetical protein
MYINNIINENRSLHIMGIYYDVDHAMKNKQAQQKAQKAQQEQARKEAEKAQKDAQEAHEKRQRGEIL